MSVQLFVYPEELETMEPSALAELVLALGCDAVSVALTYHRARRVHPRAGRVSLSPGGAVNFQPSPERYGRLVPERTAPAPLHRAIETFRAACADSGLAFRAWIVALHNESLALMHPDVAARTLDGSSTGFSLCPSVEDAVAYVAGLLADVCAQFAPDGVDLEAALYPAWEPSYALTLALEPLSGRAQLYGAQCFCDACRPVVGDLEERTRRAAGPPFGPDGGGDDEIGGELAAARSSVVRRLFRRAADAATCELCATVSGPGESAQLRGLSPDSAAEVQGLLLGVGPLEGEAGEERFRSLLRLAGDRPATVSMNWAPQRTPEAFADDARRLAASGADRLALYNLSLVPATAFEGFAAAATAFREAR